MRFFSVVCIVLICVGCSQDVSLTRDDPSFDKQFEEDRAQENFVVDMCYATLGGVPVRLEVADTPKKRQQGLSYRVSMPGNYGMIFIFDEEKVLTFWMKDTYMDLDIAFLDAEGVIVDIQQMKMGTHTVHRSRAKALYAIEMNANWFLKRNVQKGMQLEIKEFKPRMYDEYIDGYVQRESRK